MSDLNERLKQIAHKLSPAEQQSAKHLLDNYDDLPFLTADALAREAGVSASTIVRLVAKLGYSTYPDLQYEVQLRLKKRLSSLERLKNIGDRASGKGEPSFTYSSPSIEQNVKHLLQFADNLPIREIQEAAKKLLDCNEVLIAGFRASFPIAYYLSLGLKQILGPRIRLVNDVMLLPEYVASLGRRDTMMGISFPRYSSTTIKAAETAHNVQGATVISITNSVLSPIATFSDVIITCPFSGRAYQNSPLVAFALIDLLVEEIVTRIDPESLKEVERRQEQTEALLNRWEWLQESGINEPK